MPGLDPSRRRFLQATGVCASSALVAGCSSTDTGGDGTTSTATSTAADTTTADSTTTESTTTNATTETNGTNETTTETTTTASVRTVTFTDPAGAEVEATLYGGGPCGVVLVPQVNLDRGTWRTQAAKLSDRGYTVLAIDENPDDRAASVLGAVRFLHEQSGVERVVLVGASTGGEAVVRANARAESGQVAGTVALSPAGGAKRAADLQGRLLVVVSEGDDDKFVTAAKRIHERAPDPKQLVTYDGSAHGQRLFESDHADELFGTLTTFLEKACGG